jgi:3-deoxy-manno-octulosonate cytidylyltransferase (CMP-KDO synthetase)
VTHYKQICIYGFSPKALKAFCAVPRGPLEEAEDIELLRFIEHRIPVQMVEVDSDTIAVDTPSDLERVRGVLAPPTVAGVPGGRRGVPTATSVS